MDRKDFRLLEALYENSRQSYRALARRVSLSTPAVVDRLKRLERRGILQGFMLSIDPGVFDRDELILVFRHEFTRVEALNALAASDVAWASWKLDRSLTVGVWTRDRTLAKQGLIAILGLRPYEETFTQAQKNRSLSLIKLEIIDALIDEPRMSVIKLTASTGLSPKTVRKYLNRLVEEESIFVEPLLGAMADSGEVVYQLAVAGSVSMRELRRMMGDAVLVHQTQKPPMKSLLCRALDLGEVMTKTRMIEKLPEIDSVRISLNKELLVGKAFAHSLVREQIRHHTLLG